MEIYIEFPRISSLTPLPDLVEPSNVPRDSSNENCRESSESAREVSARDILGEKAWADDGVELDASVSESESRSELLNEIQWKG